MPGHGAIAFRYALLKTMARKLGDNVAVHRYCVLIAPEKMTLGSNISIHPFCYIDATGGIEISSDVSIAHSTSILSTSHQYSDPNVKIKDQPVSEGAVQIMSNVWIGCGVRILSGCRIGRGVIIAAGGVARGVLTDNNVYGGVPVKVLKRRVEH